MGYPTEYDERDEEIKQARLALAAKQPGPRVGDYITFIDGEKRRISHVWPADWCEDGIAEIQTSKGGSWHFGESGSCSFSGSLYRSIKADTLIDTLEKPLARVWFFHHGQPGANRGVDTEIPVRHFTSTERAPQS